MIKSYDFKNSFWYILLNILAIFLTVYTVLYSVHVGLIGGVRVYNSCWVGEGGGRGSNYTPSEKQDEEKKKDG